MRIADIMVADPVTIAPESRVSEAIEIMTTRGIGFIVVARERQACGVLTEGDIVGMAARGLDFASARVKAHMSSPAFAVNARANIFHAYDELVLRGMRHLVVEDDDGTLVGVVTMSSFIARLGVEHFTHLQTVAEILHPLKVTVTPDTPVAEAIGLMERHRHAMVALEGNRPVGILTSRGIARLCREGRALHRLRMRDVMKSPVPTIHRKAYVPEASLAMKERQTRHLVAVGDQGEFTGLVTISDVAHSMEGKYIEFMRTIMRDIEEELLSSGARNRALFERNPNAVFSLDCDGVIRHVNPAAILLTGYGSDELVGRKIATLFEPDARVIGETAFAEALAGNAGSGQLCLRTRAGNKAYVFISYVPIAVGEKIDGVYAVAHDITERMLAEQRLIKLSQALQQAGEPIAITDRQGIIEFANRKMHRLFGYPPEALIGMNIGRLEWVNETQPPHYPKVWRQVGEGIPYKGEILHCHHRGDPLELRLSSAPVHVPGAERVNYFINIYEDVRETRRIVQQTMQSQKLETIGTLAGGIAHDFNNYLAAVSGSLHMIRLQAGEHPNIVERIAKLEQLSERAASLVSQLLTFARKDTLQKCDLSLSELVEETRELAAMLVPKTIEQHWTIAKHVHVNGNPSQLQQVLLNLIANACDAMEACARPTLHVELSTMRLDGERGRTFPELEAGGHYAVLQVRDNGCGIADDIRDAVYDPFFTTKPPDRGTGMGLAMAYGAVRSHGGAIDFSSEPGEGTEFRVYLPMLTPQPAPQVADAPLILVADDAPLLLELVRELLCELGYEVITADNGEDALNLFRKHLMDVRLAILDIVMPRKNGAEVAQAMRGMRAEVPILFITGYDQQAIPASLLQQPGIALMRKPWQVEAFSRTVARLIKATPQST